MAKARFQSFVVLSGKGKVAAMVVTSSSLRGPIRAVIRFIDNGPGIAPDVLARLTREPVTTRAQSGGNGMGLMFCLRVMQSLGGAIEVESQPGHGASVSLHFATFRAPPA